MAFQLRALFVRKSRTCSRRAPTGSVMLDVTRLDERVMPDAGLGMPPVSLRGFLSSAIRAQSNHTVEGSSGPAQAPSGGGVVRFSGTSWPVTFSANERIVTINVDNQQWTINRPLTSPMPASQVLGRTFWVATAGNDGQAGSAASPFRTISHAVSVAAAGDLIYVKAGTYEEAPTITTSGRAGRPIIISAAPGDLGRVKVTPPSGYESTNPNGAVFTVKGNYVWINGLVIEGVRGRPGALTEEHYGSNGITWAAGFGLGCQATNNVIYHNLHCGVKEMNHGGSGILVEGNIIFENGKTSLDHGIYMPASNVTMNGNVVFNHPGFGIHSYSTPKFQVITRNVLFRNAMGGIVLAGSDNRVRFNTSVANGFGILYFRSGCTRNIVTDNIFAGNVNNGGYDNGGGRLGDPSANLDDFNCYFGSAPDPRIPPGSHELYSDPQFLDPASFDFRLQHPSPSLGIGAYARMSSVWWQLGTGNR